MVVEANANPLVEVVCPMDLVNLKMEEHVISGEVCTSERPQPLLPRYKRESAHRGCSDSCAI